MVLPPTLLQGVLVPLTKRSAPGVSSAGAPVWLDDRRPDTRTGGQ